MVMTAGSICIQVLGNIQDRNSHTGTIELVGDLLSMTLKAIFSWLDLFYLVAFLICKY